MAKTYTIQEIKIIDQFLTTLPPSGEGSLPFNSWSKSPQWSEVVKEHTDGSLRQFMTKRWKSRQIEVNPSKKELNHAYNFCPSCGFKLN